MTVFCSKCSLKYVVVDCICVKIFTYGEWKWTITRWQNIYYIHGQKILFHLCHVPKNLVSCENCGQYPFVKECPVCRKTIQKHLKSYMSSKKWIYIVRTINNQTYSQSLTYHFYSSQLEKVWNFLYEVNHIKYYEDCIYTRRFLL